MFIFFYSVRNMCFLAMQISFPNFEGKWQKICAQLAVCIFAYSWSGISVTWKAVVLWLLMSYLLNMHHCAVFNGTATTQPAYVSAFQSDSQYTSIVSYSVVLQSPRESCGGSAEARHLLFPHQTSLRSAAVVVVKKDRTGKYSPVQVQVLLVSGRSFIWKAR